MAMVESRARPASRVVFAGPVSGLEPPRSGLKAGWPLSCMARRVAFCPAVLTSPWKSDLAPSLLALVAGEGGRGPVDWCLARGIMKKSTSARTFSSMELPRHLPICPEVGGSGPTDPRKTPSSDPEARSDSQMHTDFLGETRGARGGRWQSLEPVGWEQCLKKTRIDGSFATVS